MLYNLSDSPAKEFCLNAAQCGIYSFHRFPALYARYKKIISFARKKRGICPYRMSEKLGIKIITGTSQKTFACLDYKEKTITLFSDRIAQMQQKLDALNLKLSACDLALYHELFHYIAHKNKKITRYEEFEAHCFVKELCSLPFMPVVLE